jgi:hypothetical protein
MTHLLQNLVRRGDKIFYDTIDVSYVEDCIFSISPTINPILTVLTHDGYIKHKELTCSINRASVVDHLPKIQAHDADKIEDVLFCQRNTFVFYADHFEVFTHKYGIWISFNEVIPKRYRQHHNIIIDPWYYLDFGFTIMFDGRKLECVIKDSESTLFNITHVEYNPKIIPRPNEKGKYKFTLYDRELRVHVMKYIKLVNGPFEVENGVYYDVDGDVMVLWIEKDILRVRLLNDDEEIYHSRGNNLQPQTKSARNI